MNQDQVIIFLGAPGAGKGTQAERLALEQELTKISTGDMMRAEVARGSDLGQQVAPMLAAGALVPDEILLPIIERGFELMSPLRVILDGFPRNLAQAEALDGMLERQGSGVHQVLLLEVPTDTLIARIVERGKTSGRSDDSEAVARERQDVYARQTQPLIEYYSARGVLVRLDGVGSQDEVYRRILDALEQGKPA